MLLLGCIAPYALLLNPDFCTVIQYTGNPKGPRSCIVYHVKGEVYTTGTWTLRDL